MKARLSALDGELAGVGRNLASAKDETQFEVIAGQFDELRQGQERLRVRIAELEAVVKRETAPASELESVLAIVDQLSDLAKGDQGLTAADHLFKVTNLRMFLRFAPVQTGKRVLNLLQGGVVTFGDASPPISIYSGPTSRNHVCSAIPEAAAAGEASSPAELSESGGERKSLGNVSRENRTAIELFLAGIRAWETGLRRQIGLQI